MAEEERQFPYVLKRDYRLGSPQRVFRGLQDSIEDMGYKVRKIRGCDKETEALELKPSPISDTATFLGVIDGERKLSNYRHMTYLYLGLILLAIGIALFAVSAVMGMRGAAVEGSEMGIGGLFAIIGSVLLFMSPRTSWGVLQVRLEGEAYKAAAEPTERAQELDIVADVRLTVRGRLDIRRGGSKAHDKPRDIDQETFNSHFETLRQSIENILPSYMK